MKAPALVFVIMLAMLVSIDSCTIKVDQKDSDQTEEPSLSGIAADTTVVGDAPNLAGTRVDTVSLAPQLDTVAVN